MKNTTKKFRSKVARYIRKYRPKHYATGMKSHAQMWPYFDPSEYLNRYPDIAAAGIDPFLHFIRHGWREDRLGSPYFNAAWYAKSYLTADAEMDPITDYMSGGWHRGRNPNPYFDALWYLKVNVDVKDANLEPLDHYVNWGWKEGRNPSPYFDVDYYLTQNNDVREAGMEPLLHYIVCGWQEAGRDPNPYFSTQWYKSNYARQYDPQSCALRHYMTTGSALGMKPGPDFDPSFYREANPDIAADIEPLAHFLQYGRQERRLPHPDAEPKVDLAAIQWASANSLNEQRIALLSRELGIPLLSPSPTEIAQAAFRTALSSSDVVTFDIFDTLVERRSGKPETIFAILASMARELDPQLIDFVSLRKRAETGARQAAGIREVTIVEIWDQFSQMTGMHPAHCEALARRECELEIAFCEPKAMGIELFRIALEEKRTVYLLSDIYFDRSTVEAILKKAGVNGYRTLYISSEIGSTKHYGGMFKLLLNENQLVAQNVLHIGDNPHSDIAVPRSLGFTTLQIEKSDAMSPSRILRSWFDSDVSTSTGLWQSIVSGELVHHESLLHVTAPSTIDVVKMAGAQALGPFLLAFAQFLAKKARLLGHKNLYFASRDGFYLREAYEALRPICPDLPPSYYILASRRVCRAANIKDFDDIIAVASVDHFPMPLRQFLESRFLLTDPQIAALPVAQKDLDRIIIDARTDKAMQGTLKTCSNAILERCAAHAAAYRDYLAHTGIASDGAALVDIGYRGTTQRAISSMIGAKLDGLYMVTWPEISGLLDHGLRYDAFLPSQGRPDDPIVKYVQMLELLCSATHGSIAAFEHVDGEPRPVMLPSDISTRTAHTLNALREGAINFVQSMVAGYPDLPEWQPPAANAAIGTFVEFCADPRLEVIDGLREHLFEDTFGGAVKPLIGRQTGSLNEALGDGCWTEGTVALWRATAMGFSPLPWPTDRSRHDRFYDTSMTIPGFRDLESRA